MYEWIQEDAIKMYYTEDISKSSKKEVYQYVANGIESNDYKRFAIVSDGDEYMGIASLKYVDVEKGYAQIFVAVRKAAMARGYSWFAVCELLRIAFEEMNLESVYWCISHENVRAVRFCDKHFLKRIIDVPLDIKSKYANRNDLIWYSVLRGDDYLNEALNRASVAGCKIIKIKTIPTINAGELSVFEGCRDVDFDIKRVYYVSKVPEGTRRGFHAHIKLKQIIYCPYGSIQLILDNGKNREEITLSDPSIGIIIDHPVWREMLWLQKDSVLCVASSDYYDEDDYIRDYKKFKSLISLGLL